ncbi:Transcription factor TFIIE alpha subunit [Zea mays]|uniref:Transcription factor TFIIE alpha subunit n=1 Tax=Zea mays TaxID=4577 RepID=A0A1D6G639_MAIZE|nr:Transcription factor TFIIE alpha subunit [Zea mays]AQK98660.1 Transcription factor TFIIE alpha subunit [Zea mays]
MDRATLIEGYHNKIEVELNKICVGILKLFASHLPPSLIVPKSKVFYLKMKGDYYRILLWRSWPPYPIRLWLMLNLSTLLILLVVSPNRQSQRMKGTHSQQQPKS